MYGHYPAIMRNLLEDRLPNFSEDEGKALKGSFDFIGLNHYTSHYAKYEPDGPEFSRYGVEFHDARVASICMSLPKYFFCFIFRVFFVYESLMFISTFLPVVTSIIFSWSVHWQL